MQKIPNPDVAFPNEYRTSCFLKNVITSPNILLICDKEVIEV